MDEEDVASFQVFGADFFLQIGQARANSGRGLDEFSRQVFHALDLVRVLSCHVGRVVPESLLMRNVHADAVFRGWRHLGVGSAACQKTDQQSHTSDWLHSAVLSHSFGITPTAFRRPGDPIDRNVTERIDVVRTGCCSHRTGTQFEVTALVVEREPMPYRWTDGDTNVSPARTR